VARRRARHGRQPDYARIVNAIIGATLVVIGLAVGWLPGRGGFSARVGSMLVAVEFPMIARSLDQLESSFQQAWRSVTGVWNRYWNGQDK
jgi:hypothetical protein